MQRSKRARAEDTAAAKRAPVARAEDTAAAKRAPVAIVIEGLAVDADHAADVGIFELMEGVVVHDRPVWKQLGERPASRTAYLYYSDYRWWCISDLEDMQGGVHQGSLMAESEASTPDAIEAGRWHVHDSQEWSAPAPTVCARVCKPDECDARRRVLDAEELLAVAAGKKASLVVVEGVAEDEEYWDSMGMYVLEAGVTVNGRCVWKLQESTEDASTVAADDEQEKCDNADEDVDDDEEEEEDTFLYFASSSEWFISLKANAMTGDPIGWLKCHDSEPAAVTPDQLDTGRWEVYDVESESWSLANNVCARLGLSKP